MRRPVEGEFEMGCNRIGFAVLTLAFVMLLGGRSSAAAVQALLVYTTLGIGLSAHILCRPQLNDRRRVFALVIDIAIVTYEMHVGGGSLAALFSLYLWITFGNGFRFGIRWLQAAAIAACCGFAYNMAMTPFWRDQPGLSYGLMLGLIALPAYAGKLIRRLSKAQVQAEAASHAKTMFMASVSHELRTPLTAIIGMSSLLRDTGLGGEQREMNQVVQDAAKALTRLIDEVLDHSRLEAGRMPVKPVAFDLADLLREVAGLVTVQARDKGLHLSLNIAPGSQRHLLGSRRHIAEIATNLASNAVKFTKAGSVTIAADARRGDDGIVRLVIEVIDTGIGIAPGAQVKVFEPFTQANDNILNDYGGTGLGLSIARRRAELLGGTLELISTLDVGSTFRLSVDVQAVNRVESEPSRPQVVALASTEDAAALLVSCLAGIGLPCEVHGNLETAIGAVRRQRDANGSDTVLVIIERDLDQNIDDLVVRLRETNPAMARSTLLLHSSASAPADRRHQFFSVLLEDVTASDLLSTLQLARGQDHAEEAPSSTPASNNAAIFGLNILIADDNRINQRVMVKILDRAGHRSRVVGDGDAALDALEGDEAFDLVLMDINMPKLDGIQATKLFRIASLGRPHVPVIALTADASEEMAARCLAAGMDAVATKPIEPAQLEELIAKLAVARPETDAKDVVSIAEHPRYRPPLAGLVDLDKLAVLHDLGGDEFVCDLLDDFLTEAEQTVTLLEDAVSGSDIVAFRFHAHALRSSAVNVGAQGLGRLCDPWQRMGMDELATQAAQVSDRARSELGRTRAAFDAARVSLSSVS